MAYTPEFDFTLYGTPGTSGYHARKIGFNASLNSELARLWSSVSASDNLGSLLYLSTLSDPAPTSQTMSAAILSGQDHISLSLRQHVSFRWEITNTAPDPVLTVGSSSYVIKTRNGTAFAPGELQGARSYIGYVYASGIIRLRESVAIVDIIGLRAALDDLMSRITTEVETRASYRIPAFEAAPGDGVVVVQDKSGNALLGTHQNGNSFGRFELVSPRAPGDYVVGLVEDSSGKILLGVDTRDGSIYPGPPLEGSSAPGDYIIPLILNSDGSTAFGIDRRDGTAYPVSGGGSGGGSTVEFVDPDNQGDAWNSIQTEDDQGTVIRYLSRQWRETWGYEKRGNITLAQTPNPAIGILHFGGGSGAVVRPLVDDFPYHVVNQALVRPEDGLAASAAAVAWLEGEFAARRGLPTVVALTQVVSSTVEADALAGSTHRVALRNKVTAARTALEGWGKELFVDRIGLALLEGAPTTGQATADLHYAAVAASLRSEIADAAGQIPMPVVVVSQSAGTRTDGTSPVILAEGNLDWAHWSLGLIVATPKYPFPLQAGSPATLTPDAALQVSELEALAASERLAARDWYGPTMGAQASRSGAVITVPFTAMSALVLRDPARHGFAVDGVTNGATISSVAVSGSNVLITMSAAPAGTLTVRYAWGQTGDQGDGYPANRGSLTDSWSQPSRMVSGATLYRYARSGRAPVA